MNPPSSLLGYHINQYGAYRWADGSKWVRISLQIDERDANGDYVLPEGLPYTAHTDDGISDSMDEFVLDPNDILPGENDQLAEPDFNLLQPYTHYSRIGLCDTQRLVGRAYLVVHQSSAPGHWPIPKTDFSPTLGRVETDVYRYDFRDDHPALLGRVQIADTASNSYQDAIASGHFMIDLKLPWFLPNFNLSDSDFTSEVESWKNGPIRSIVAIGVRYRRFLGIFNFHFFSELVFSTRSFQIPTPIEIPFSPTSYLHPGSGLAFFLKFFDASTWRLTTNLLKLSPVPADDLIMVRDRRESRPADEHLYEVRATNGKFSVLAGFSIDRHALEKVPPPLQISKEMSTDSAFSTHWPWLKDYPYDIGMFIDLSQIERGRYLFGLDLLVNSTAKGDESFEDPYQVTWDPVSRH